MLPKGQPRKTRILYDKVISGEDRLEELVHSIKQCLSEAGFVISSKFLSHLTIARVKHSDQREEISRRWLAKKLNSFSVRVDKLVLVESILTPNGPIYLDQFIKKFD